MDTTDRVSKTVATSGRGRKFMVRVSIARLLIPFCLLVSLHAQAVVVEKRSMGGRASYTSDDCSVFQYPDVISTAGSLAAAENRGAASIGLGLAPGQEYAQQARWQAIRQMRHAIAIGDRLTFQDALFAYSEGNPDAGSIARHILPVYFYAYALGFHFPDDLLLKGMRYSPESSALGWHQQIEDLPFVGLAEAIREAEIGKTDRARTLLDGLDADTSLVSEQFQRAFLAYLISMVSMTEVDEAIDVLIRLEENEEVFCNPTLLGVAQIYKAELHEMAAEQIPKPQSDDQTLLFRYRASVMKRLHFAKENLAESRRNIDVVYHPALWRHSVERAARVMGKMKSFGQDAPPHFRRSFELLETTLREYAIGQAGHGDPFSHPAPCPPPAPSAPRTP